MITRAVTGKYLKPALMAVLLAGSILYLLRPVIDPDFFWHLRTGQWIWDNKQLLTKDIFAFTTPPGPTVIERVILTSYWLSEVIFYLFYMAGGMNGIVVLRFLLFGVLFCVVALRMRGEAITSLCLLLIFVITLLEIYPLERPHLFSFIFFGLLLYLLDRTTTSEGRVRRRYFFLLPVVMLLWANSHGGFVLGQVTIVLYLLAEGLKFAHQSLHPLNRDQYRGLLIAGSAGLACSLANPNTYHVLPILFGPAPYEIPLLIEYQSTVAFYKALAGGNAVILYWVLLLTTGAVLLLNIKKANLTKILLLAGLGYFSFTTVRYIPFFLIASLPAVSEDLGQTRQRAFFRAFLLLTVILSAAFFMPDERFNIRNPGAGRWYGEKRFPVRAADFIAGADLRGNMFNFFDWGGYLIWRLGPERKVFIDGRALDQEAFRQSYRIVTADTTLTAGLPAWKSALNAYSIKYVVTKCFSQDNTVVPLVHSLIRDREWVPVFFYVNSVIFVRDDFENRPVIAKYAVPREYIEGLLSGSFRGR